MSILTPFIAVLIAGLCSGVLLACYVAVQMIWPPAETSPSWARAGLALILFGLSGYVTFFVALASLDLFIVLKTAYFTLALALLVSGAIKEYYGWREVRLAACFALVIVFYVALLFSVGQSGDPTALAATRFTHQLPMDNILPKVLADQLLKGGVRIPMIGDWHASDRPPLQAGLYSLLRFGADKFSYQVICMSLQLLALPAVAILLRAVGGLSTKVLIWTMAAVAVSPVFLMFTIFVWPKLLAAAFALIATAFVIGYFRGDVSLRLAWIGIGVSAGLSFAAHGGTAFYLLSMGLSALIILRLPLGVWFGAALGFFATYLPWLVFQKFIDPPGDRLLKWMLAGHIPPTQRSFLEVLSDSYANVTFDAWWDGRLANFSKIGADIFQHAGHLLEILASWRAQPAETLERIRATEFFEFLPSQQLLLGAGVLALAVNLVRGMPWRREYVFLCATVAVATAFWALLMFAPGSATNHQGALASNLVLTALLAISVGTLDWRFLAATVGLTAWLNFRIYMLKGVGEVPVNWWWVGVASICAIGLGASFYGRKEFTKT